MGEGTSVDAVEQLTLGDGRTLAWRECGDPDGRPVVHAHGGLFSGAYARLADADCRRLGLRLVTPDRPGIGRSSPQPGRTTGDWADDVVALADHLGFDRFATLGWSMGGQYAMGLAARLPKRTEGLVVVAGAPPLDDPSRRRQLNATDRRLTTMAAEHRRRARTTFRAMGLMARHARKLTNRSIGRPLSPADRAIVTGLPADVLPAAMAEAMHDPDGMAEEYRAWVRPWGFDPGAITCPTTVVRGTTDQLIPRPWAEEVRRLTEATLVEPEGAGHMLLLADWAAALQPLAG